MNWNLWRCTRSTRTAAAASTASVGTSNVPGAAVSGCFDWWVTLVIGVVASLASLVVVNTVTSINPGTSVHAVLERGLSFGQNMRSCVTTVADNAESRTKDSIVGVMIGVWAFSRAHNGHIISCRLSGWINEEGIVVVRAINSFIGESTFAHEVASFAIGGIEVYGLAAILCSTLINAFLEGISLDRFQSLGPMVSVAF